MYEHGMAMALLDVRGREEKIPLSPSSPREAQREKNKGK
jgi:hypothetical protein